MGCPSAQPFYLLLFSIVSGNHYSTLHYKIHISLRHIWVRLQDCTLCGPNLFSLTRNAPLSLTRASVSLSSRKALGTSWMTCKPKQLWHLAWKWCLAPWWYPQSCSPHFRYPRKQPGYFTSSYRQPIDWGFQQAPRWFAWAAPSTWKSPFIIKDN